MDSDLSRLSSMGFFFKDWILGFPSFLSFSVFLAACGIFQLWNVGSLDEACRI